MRLQTAEKLTRGRFFLCLELSLFVVVALVLRWTVLSQTRFNWPSGEDLFIYFDMIQSILEQRGAKIDFIYHFLTPPPQISHLEDYYEPLYAYFASICLWGSKVTYFDSLCLPLLSSLWQVLCIYWLTHRLTQSRSAARIAATWVCIHPLLIERSLYLMKESFVGALYLSLILLMSYQQEKPSPRHTLGLACLSVLIGLVQYESQIVLGLSFCLYFIAKKQFQALGLFLGVFSLGLGIYWFWFYTQTGLILASKMQFFTGSYTGASFNQAKSVDLNTFILKIQRSGLYIVRRSLTFLRISFLILAVFGLKSHWPKAHTFFGLILITVYVAVHGIAVDLLLQDYLVLILLLTPYAAAAIVALYQEQSAGDPHNWNVLRFIWWNTLLFWVLGATAWSDHIFYAPKFASRILIPACLAALIVMIWTQQTRFKKAKSACAAGLVLLISLEFSVSYAYQEAFSDKSLKYLPIAELGGFLQKKLPPHAVILTESYYELHYFTGLATVKAVPSEQSCPYGVNYALSIPPAVLTSWGFQFQKMFDYAGQTLYKITCPAQQEKKGK